MIIAPNQAPPLLAEMLQHRLDGILTRDTITLPPEDVLADRLRQRLATTYLAAGYAIAAQDSVELLGRSLADLGPDPTFEDLSEFLARLTQLMLKNAGQGPRELTEDDITILYGQLYELTNPAMRAVVAEWYDEWTRDTGQVRPWPALLELLCDISVWRGGRRTIAANFLERHPAPPGFTGQLGWWSRDRLRSALSKLPVVEDALNGRLLDHRPLGAVEPTGSRWWADVRQMLEQGRMAVRETPDAGWVQRVPPPHTTDSIERACWAVVRIVEPEVLERLPSPVFQVQMTPTGQREPNLRAFADGLRVKITVDASAPVTTLVHEIGHTIENMLPVDCCVDLQRLLRARHGGDAQPLTAIYPSHRDPEVRQEAAYNGTSPLNDRYFAKVYNNAATEVMSMTLETLVQADQAQQLLDDDPHLLALVLRWICPNQLRARLQDMPTDMWPSPR